MMKINRWWMTGVLMAAGLAMAGPARAASSLPEKQRVLAERMEKQMLEFVRNNYPSGMDRAVRGLQNEESSIRKKLMEAVNFFTGFALGSVTFEGRWEGQGSRPQYLMLSTVRGVQNYPKAMVFFRTYPGMLRPFTVVQVDDNGDGKVDAESPKLCQREKMVEWLAQRFPQAVCLASRQ